MDSSSDVYLEIWKGFNMKPKVTILCITYNHEKYIAKALESYVSQETNFPFVVYVGDDASTDRTPEIIMEYAKKYPDIIKPVLRKENLGGLRNYWDLAERIESEFVYQTDGDDYFLSPYKLQKQYDFLSNHPDYSICFNQTKMVYLNFDKPSKIIPEEKHVGNKNVFTLKELAKENFIGKNPMYRWAFHEKGSLKKQYPKFKILPGDWFLHLLHAQTGKIYFIREVLDVYVRHSEGMWNSESQQGDGFDLKYGIYVMNLYLLGYQKFNKSFSHFLYFYYMRLYNVFTKYNEKRKIYILEKKFKKLYIKFRNARRSKKKIEEKANKVKMIIKNTGKYVEPTAKDLNKICEKEYWKIFLKEEDISPNLFYYNEKLSKEKAKTLFKKYVCVVDIETSTVCNRKCDYCPLSIHDRKKQTLIDDKLYSQIISDLGSIDFDSTISLNLYNEPLLDDKIYSRIKEARKACPNSFIKFNSNGDYLTREILDKLVDSGLNALFITLHTPKGQPYFHEDRTIAFKKFFDKLGLDFDYDLIIPNKMNASDNYYRGMRLLVESHNWAEIGNDRGGIIKSLSCSSRTSPCVRPIREFTIAHDGLIYHCCQFFSDRKISEHAIMGKVDDMTSIFDIYTSKAVTDLRKKLFVFGNKQKPCSTCNDFDYSPKNTKRLRDKILSELGKKQLQHSNK